MTRAFRVVYREQTALAPETVVADSAHLARGEGLVVFEPTVVDGRYLRPAPIPIRFLESVIDDSTGDVVYSQG